MSPLYHAALYPVELPQNPRAFTAIRLGLMMVSVPATLFIEFGTPTPLEFDPLSFSDFHSISDT
jgi:hypothetical protein